MIIKKWFVHEPPGKRRGCIIGLPGRGVPGDMMERFCYYTGLPDAMIVTFEPDKLRWYPQPNGPTDQTAAVAGLADAVAEVQRRISTVQRAFRLRRDQIAVVGYSAGAVLALQLLAAAEKPLAAVVGFAGCIFEPDRMPAATTQTPVLLRHAVDDECFSWEERYLPMKEALQRGKYNLFVTEKTDGSGHSFGKADAYAIGRWLAPRFGYRAEELVDRDAATEE